LNHGQIVRRCNRHFVAAPPRISRIPIMKYLSAPVALLLMASVPARADPPKVAVFDLELVDTSLQGEVDGPRTDEQRRLMRTGDQLALGGIRKVCGPRHRAGHCCGARQQSTVLRRLRRALRTTARR
jgi:hypothetical protein